MKRFSVAFVLTILCVITVDVSAVRAQVEELVPPQASSGVRVGPRISTRPLPQQSIPQQTTPQQPVGVPMGAPLGGPIMADEGLIIGENLIVALGAKPDRIWAFSRERGSWNRQTIPQDQLYGPIVPQVSSNLVAFQMGKKLYAFSAPRGEWHTHDLERHVQVSLNVGPDMAWCRVGGRVYAFSAKHGGWSSIDVYRD
jgi:hypothetical protein